MTSVRDTVDQWIAGALTSTASEASHG